MTMKAENNALMHRLQLMTMYNPACRRKATRKMKQPPWRPFFTARKAVWPTFPLDGDACVYLSLHLSNLQ